MKKLNRVGEISFVSFLSFATLSIGLLVMPACQTSSGKQQDDQAQKQEEQQKQEMAQQQQEGDQQADEDRVTQEDMSQLEQEVQKELDQEGKTAIFHYGKARSLFTKGLHKQAYQHVTKALKLRPNMDRALKLRNRLADILGYSKKFKGRLSEQERRFQAMKQQNRKDIEAKKKKARSLMSEKEYEKAKELLENLLIRLKGAAWLEDPKFKSLKQEVQTLRDRAATLAEKRKQVIREELRQEAKQKALQEERQRMLRELRWTDRLMEKAIIYFKQQRFQKAISVTNIILSKYPQFQAAKDLKEDAERAYQQHWEKNYLMTKIEQWKNFQERMLELNIPYQAKIKFPSEQYWRRVNKRAKELGPGRLTPEEKDEGKRNILSIKRKLETERVSLEFVDANLEQVSNFIEQNTGLNIVIDDSVRERANISRNIVANKLRLKNAMSLVTHQYGLDYQVKNGVVFVTSPEKTRAESELQIYNVQNIANRIKNFPAPNMGLKERMEEKNNFASGYSAEGESESDTPTPGLKPYSDDEKNSSGKPGDIPLASIIRKNIAPESWAREDTSIRMMLNGQLFVHNTPEVHAKIENFLQDVRDFAGSMVHVEVRFLELREEWLEQFGIELRNLSGASAGTPDGVFHQEGTTTAGTPGLDLRFTSNFDARNDLQTGNLPALDNIGGLGLTYEKLGDTDYNIVLRALDKSEKLTVLESASLTLFNTQRANVTLAEQEAYIQDIDIQVATATQAFDPIIGVIQTGLVLDVRPIISFDRRFITLEIQPSIATVDQIRSFAFTNLGVQIQLPQVTLRKAASTIRIPDQGAVLIGGLHRTQDSKIEEGIPILEDIPIIGAFFKETINVEANRQIFILVSAEIVDTAEVENEVFGTGSAFQDNASSSGSGSGSTFGD